MHRARLDASIEAPNFIGCWNIDNPQLCADIIDLFETNAILQRPGETFTGLRPEGKQTTDIVIHPKDLETPRFKILNVYIDYLHRCFKDYLEQWPFLRELGVFHIGSFNIQRYREGDHFQKLHTERSAIGNSHRVLAWMTYLNDVPSGGETCFPHYDLEIRPVAGQTLIWPVEWTHAHRGNVVRDATKYIVTGWMHFPK